MDYTPSKKSSSSRKRNPYVDSGMRGSLLPPGTTVHKTHQSNVNYDPYAANQQASSSGGNTPGTYLGSTKGVAKGYSTDYLPENGTGTSSRSEYKAKVPIITYRGEHGSDGEEIVIPPKRLPEGGLKRTKGTHKNYRNFESKKSSEEYYRGSNTSGSGSSSTRRTPAPRRNSQGDNPYGQGSSSKKSSKPRFNSH